MPLCLAREKTRVNIPGSFAGGLQGIEQLSHIIVIFVMHQSTFESVSDLVRRPRGLSEMPQIGIFAQRARHRLNPIGITAVRLIRVEGRVLRVRGLDAIDGTLVLDIKPYFPVYDHVPGAVVPEWVERLMIRVPLASI